MRAGGFPSKRRRELIESGGTTLSLGSVADGSALVRSGTSIIGTNRAWAIGATSTPAMKLTNTTAATAGTTVQMSPALELGGTAWASGAGASVEEVWRIDVLPATGGTGSSTLQFSRSGGGGAYYAWMTLNSSGTLQPIRVSVPGTTGYVRAAGIQCAYDAGGVATNTCMTNVTLAAGANPPTMINVPGTGAAGQVGWMKFYVGTTAVAVPYWAAA